MLNLSQEQQNDIRGITKYAEWKFFRKFLDDFSAQVADLRNDYVFVKEKKIDPAVEATARLLAYSTLQALLSYMDSISEEKKTKKESYE